MEFDRLMNVVVVVVVVVVLIVVDDVVIVVILFVESVENCDFPTKSI